MSTRRRLVAPRRLLAAAARPPRHPVRLASETVAVAETVLVRVVDAAGRDGWGEASSAPTMIGDLPPGMVAAVERVPAPALLAAPVADAAAGARRLHRVIRGDTGTRSAADALARAQALRTTLACTIAESGTGAATAQLAAVVPWASA